MLLKKTFQFSLVTTLMFGVLQFSAQAKPTKTQTITQQTTIYGDNNRDIQVIRQVNVDIEYSGKPSNLKDKVDRWEDSHPDASAKDKYKRAVQYLRNK
jgi:hypothetical protein